MSSISPAPAGISSSCEGRTPVVRVVVAGIDRYQPSVRQVIDAETGDTWRASLAVEFVFDEGRPRERDRRDGREQGGAEQEKQWQSPSAAGVVQQPDE